MTPYYIWVALAALVWCVGILSLRLLGLLRKGAPKDLSRPSGSVAKGVVYSCTTAMLPQHKESAYLHLPTYAGGICLHIGIFSGFLVFLWSFCLFFLGAGWMMPSLLLYALSALLLAAGLCGLAMLAKRIVKKDLRALSLPDDYISGGLVALFLLTSSAFLFGKMPLEFYYIVSALLLFWTPIGKTRHLLYFFAARYHLGFFYGRRGAWPTSK
jgi:hypothetical protein